MGAPKNRGRFAQYFPEKLPTECLGTRLTDRISRSRLYEKCGSIPLSIAMMRERLKWLGHVLRMKDDRLPKIVLGLVLR